MTIYYLDPSLTTNLGHHAQSARAIRTELFRFGEVRAFGNADMGIQLQEELNCFPHFTHSAYWTNTGDPICGWLTAFLAAANQFEADLHELDIADGDILYVNSGQAAQLQGLIQFLAKRSVQAVIEFGVDPGLSLEWQNGERGYAVRNPMEDARGTLYRFIGTQMPGNVLSRLWMATFDEQSSDAYSTLMGRPVHTLPVPRDAVGPIRCRRPDYPITVSFLGHQRIEKGHHLIPDIIRNVLADRVNDKVNFLVHNGASGTPIDDEIRRMTLEYPIEFDERLADDAIWAELLDKCDLIVLPYNPERFSLSYSAVACEALANGIPMVVPSDTTMSKMLYLAGGGTRFGSWRVDCIAESVMLAVEYFGLLAERAEAGAIWWRKNHGAKNTVNGMMSLIGIREACHEKVGC